MQNLNECAASMIKLMEVSAYDNLPQHNTTHTMRNIEKIHGSPLQIFHCFPEDLVGEDLIVSHRSVTGHT